MSIKAGAEEDGKTLRRSFDRAASASPLHLVCAWAAEERLVLGQMRAAADSNEITAVPALLKLLSLEGAVVELWPNLGDDGLREAVYRGG